MTNISGHWCKNTIAVVYDKNRDPPDVVLIYPKTWRDFGSMGASPFPLLTILALL